MSAAPETVHRRKFTFETEFDGGRPASASVPYKRVYSAEEVEALAAAARAEGEAAAMQRIEAQTARALSELAEAAKLALPALAAAAHEHRAGSAELALACARQIADAACDRFPEAPLQAALAALAREVEATPKLDRCAPPPALHRAAAGGARRDRRGDRLRRPDHRPGRSRPAARRLRARLGRRLGRVRSGRARPPRVAEALRRRARRRGPARRSARPALFIRYDRGLDHG